MNIADYQLPKNEKLYYPLRCKICSYILRVKLYIESDEIILLISCQCGLITKTNYRDDNINKDTISLTKDDWRSKSILEKLPDYECKLHNHKYIAFCKECNKDKCEECLKEDKNHDILLYSDIIPNSEEFIKKYNKIESTLDIFLKFWFSKNKGLSKKSKYRLIIKKNFKLREILRNFFYNFSRKKENLNFALIYNVIENCELNSLTLDNLKKLGEEELQHLYFLKYKDFLIFGDNNKKSSKYYIKYNVQTLIKSLSYIEKIYITYCHKYICIFGNSTMKLYNSISFELLFTYKNNSNLYEINIADNISHFCICFKNHIKLYKNITFDYICEYKLNSEKYYIQENEIIILNNNSIIILGIDIKNKRIFEKYLIDINKNKLSDLNISKYVWKVSNLKFSNDYLSFEIDSTETKRQYILIYERNNNYRLIKTVDNEIFEFKYIKYSIINNNSIIIWITNESSENNYIYVYDINLSKVRLLLYCYHFIPKILFY